MAEHRAPRIADRDDEYKARRRNMVISPERHDPFAIGNNNLFSFFGIFIMRILVFFYHGFIPSVLSPIPKRTTSGLP